MGVLKPKVEPKRTMVRVAKCRASAQKRIDAFY